MTEVAVFLRGINVGGHHKVPMAELKTLLIEAGFKGVKTLLNSGNVILKSELDNLDEIKSNIEELLSSHFGFRILLVIVEMQLLRELVEQQPFQLQPSGKEFRHYVSFLNEPLENSEFPWGTEDGVFEVFRIDDRMVFSVLNLGLIQTTLGMEMLDQRYGKRITTRNWNTIAKVASL